MSVENVELVRSMYRQGGPGRLFDLVDERAVVDVSDLGMLPERPNVIRGKDDLVDYFRHCLGTWEDYAIEPIEILDAGDGRVIAVHYERGRGRCSGTPFERHWATVYTLRADKLVRWTTFSSRENALEAAGVSE